MDSENSAKYKLQDLIKIVKQPKNLNKTHDIVGARGYVDNLQGFDSELGHIYYILTFPKDSGNPFQVVGWGSIPEDCIARCYDADLEQIKRNRDTMLGKLAENGKAEFKRRKEGIAKFAKKHGIQVEIVEAFLDDYHASDLYT